MKSLSLGNASTPASPVPVKEEVKEAPRVVEKEVKNLVVHDRVICDGCKMNPIIGIRYKCGLCQDFDMCSTCESSANAVHDRTHPLVKIRVPRVYPVSDENVSQEAKKEEEVTRPNSPSKKCGNGHHKNHRREKTGKSFAKFITDVSVPDRSYLIGGTETEKIWRLQNNGKYSWPAGFKVVVVSGDEKVIQDKEITLPTIVGGEEFDVKIRIVVPKEAGRYVAYFRLINLEGEKFGPRFWVDFYVPEPVEVKPLVTPVAEPKKEEYKYQAQLEELNALGFSDESLNMYLLEKFNGNSSHVVNWLLDQAAGK